jgi:hydrogenase maturation factor
MCLTFPGEVVAMEGEDAIVRSDGRLRRASTLALPDVAIGDRVIVAAGSIVSRLDPTDADEIERLVRAAHGRDGAPR